MCALGKPSGIKAEDFFSLTEICKKKNEMFLEARTPTHFFRNCKESSVLVEMKISINAYSVSCTRNNVNLCYIHLYLLDVSISVLLKSSSFCLCTLLVKCNDEE